MSRSTEELLVAFVTAFRDSGGNTSPVEYILQAEDDRRDELAALIDLYLSQAPGREWDARDFVSSSAERLTDRLERALLGFSGEWPLILPSHRHEAELTRSEVVEQLAAKLEAADETERIADYYHGMENGMLSARGVSDLVLGALGEIFGTTAAALRRAGKTLGGDSSGFDGAVFARVSGEGDGLSGGDHGDDETGLDQDHLVEVPHRRDRDRIDRLFLGDED